MEKNKSRILTKIAPHLGILKLFSFISSLISSANIKDEVAFSIDKD